MKMERRVGPTPNGGAVTELFYYDNIRDMNPVDKKKATAVKIVEMDVDDSIIATTYGEFDGSRSS